METTMNKIEMPLLPKTPAEQAREQLHNRICSRYLVLKSQYPSESDSRIFTAIANEVKRTLQNVRDVLIKNQLYQPKNKSL